jgi:hypothetical protein
MSVPLRSPLNVSEGAVALTGVQPGKTVVYLIGIGDRGLDREDGNTILWLGHTRASAEEIATKLGGHVLGIERLEFTLLDPEDAPKTP